MTTVHTVFVQLHPPKNGDAGRVIEGCFIYEDDTVTLTNRNGEPAIDGEGKRYSQKLKEGESPRQIAGRLTKELRNALRGRDSVSGFDGPISYPRQVLA